MPEPRSDDPEPEDIVLLVPDPHFDEDGEQDQETMLGEEYVEPSAEPVDVGDQIRKVADRVAGGVAAAREFTPSQAPRPGATVEERRAGDTAEIMQTCHVRPQLTEQLLLEGKLDDTRIEALALRGAPEREGPHHFKWPTRLYTGLFWWRATLLHVSSTPSSNLTILELVPKRHWKRGTRRFIKRGVRSVEALASRIETLASSLPSSASGQPRDQ